jgi:hypothetical protein
VEQHDKVRKGMHTVRIRMEGFKSRQVRRLIWTLGRAFVASLLLHVQETVPERWVSQAKIHNVCLNISLKPPFRRYDGTLKHTFVLP